ncbi:CHAT domain-containing protein [Chryseolinea soli]|nr:CHAT domain-containing tetratricopeptide repeat protein [Chryseolinea soli]
MKGFVFKYTVILLFGMATGFTALANSVDSTLYKEGKAWAERDKEKSFQLLERAMNQAQVRQETGLHILSVVTLSKLDFEGNPERQRRILTWIDQALKEAAAQRQQKNIALLHMSAALLQSEANHFYDSTLYHYEFAQKILTTLYGEWNDLVATCYHGRADMYKYYLFDFEKAEKLYEKSLQIREHIHWKKEGDFARLYYNLATTNRSQQDYEKAIAYGIKTIDIVKRMNNPGFLERCYDIVANIYRDMGDTKQARVYYQQAISLNLKNHNAPQQQVWQLAWHYQGLAKSFDEDSLFDEAIVNFSKSVAIYRKSKNDNILLYTECLFNMALAYLHRGDNARALDTYRELILTVKRMNMAKERIMAETYVGLGDYFRATHSVDSSIFYYQKALTVSAPGFTAMPYDANPTLQQVGLHYFTYRMLSKKAEALTILYETKKDARYLRQALACLMLSEKLMTQGRNALDIEESKWKFLDSNFHLYDQIVSTLHTMMTLQPNESLLNLAFHYFERSKSYTLNSALGKAERDRKINVNDAAFQKYNALTRALFTAQDKLSREKEKDHPDEKSIDAMRQEVVSLDRDIQALKPQLEEKYPGYFTVTSEPPVPSIQQMKNFLKKENDVIIEYFWGNRWVYGLALNKDHASFKRLGRTDSLQTHVQNLLQHFADEHSSISKEVFTNFTVNAYALHQRLVAPFGEMLQPNQRLQIIPDGLSSQIPFEVLLTKPSQPNPVNYHAAHYLIRYNRVGYAYSSSTLLNKAKRHTPNPVILAMGYTGGKRLRAAAESLTEIEGAEKELEALERRFSTGKFLSGPEVTEANFKTLAPAYDIIHLAIHGKGDAEQNYSSSLFFRSKSDSLEDGELHAYELYGLKLKANLAVLSSCESGLGRAYKGEGMISMASAFVFSGCQNILMSLWKVNDQAAVVLMDNFYGGLLEGERIDEALAQAKLDYVNHSDEITADPKIWAPLVAYGNLDPVFQKDRSRTLFAVLGAFMVLLVGYAALRKFRSRY